MRYDNTVEFIEEVTKYDPKIGEEVTSIVNTEKVRANVTDASEKVMRVAFGDLRQGSKVARIQGNISFSPTHLIVGGVKFKAVMKRVLRHKTSYILEEVTNG
ncbi:hypothetical protein [Lactococcus lactis]|uniref:hypothetical protein n=1 Tax=Lactococcus lactis TaxID=1358 RepID=UPI0024183D0B|nr:hypothetical protein [Lactococcus lactis]